MKNLHLNSLVLQVQGQYRDWAAEGCWQCPNGHIFKSEILPIHKTVWCPECEHKTHKFFPLKDKPFESPEINEIFLQCSDIVEYHKQKISQPHMDKEVFAACANVRILKSILCFNPKKNASFETFARNCVAQELSIYKWSFLKSKYLHPVQCKLCGHDVSLVSNKHLLTEVVPADGFEGHEKIIQLAKDSAKKPLILYMAMFDSAGWDMYNNIKLDSKIHTVTEASITATSISRLSIMDACRDLVSKHIKSIYDDLSPRKQSLMTIDEVEQIVQKVVMLTTDGYNMTEVAQNLQITLDESKFWLESFKKHYTIGTRKVANPQDVIEKPRRAAKLAKNFSGVSSNQVSV